MLLILSNHQSVECHGSCYLVITVTTRQGILQYIPSLTITVLNGIVPVILSLQLQQDKELNEIVLLILQYIPSLTITVLNGIVPVILSITVTTRQGIKRDSTVDSPVYFLSNHHSVEWHRSCYLIYCSYNKKRN